MIDDNLDPEAPISKERTPFLTPMRVRIGLGLALGLVSAPPSSPAMRVLAVKLMPKPYPYPKDLYFMIDTPEGKKERRAAVNLVFAPDYEPKPFVGASP